MFGGPLPDILFPRACFENTRRRRIKYEIRKGEGEGEREGRKEGRREGEKEGGWEGGKEGGKESGGWELSELVYLDLVKAWVRRTSQNVITHSNYFHNFDEHISCWVFQGVHAFPADKSH